ncbi:hypothetical protein, partial [Vibrio parahaemolyticus]|uniref:hypothetical protein n=1 Tax=Vibrio parahaemolyticus TaxID=670 RepID=UPI002115396A
LNIPFWNDAAARHGVSPHRRFSVPSRWQVQPAPELVFDNAAERIRTRTFMQISGRFSRQKAAPTDAALQQHARKRDMSEI